MTHRDKAIPRELQALSTPELDRLLQAELRKEEPSQEVVLPILQILEERQKDRPVEITPQLQAAWEKYQQNIRSLRQKKTPRKMLLRVAAVAAVVCIVLLAIPRSAGADDLFDAFVYITDSVLQFFAPDDPQKENVFETENPGLQQLYNTVSDAGVTVPVVPTWLPEGFELDELKVMPQPNGTRINAGFFRENESIVILYKISNETTTTQFEKEDEAIESYEVGGKGHAITVNDDMWSATWVNENVECWITVDLDKEELLSIIDSVYRRNA